MKKLISVLLAALMLTTLISCQTAGSGPASPAASGSASSSVSPSAAAPAPTEPAATSAAPASAAPADVTTGANPVGFFTDGVDPSSRKTYKLVYAYTMTMLLSQMMTDSMNAFKDKLNFTLTTTTGELDADKYITNIETLANNGEVDGFIAEIDPQVGTRINEVYQELKIPYIGLFNSIRDEAGPCIGLDQKAAGATTIQWLYDNYKKYWGDIDTSQIALLDFTFSTLPDLQGRADGAIEKFKELFPNNTMFFTADAAVTNTVDADSSYKTVSPIFTAHPDVKYWWVPCSIETLAQGTARAAEALNMQDRVLITDVGSDVLCSEWETNYDGCWVSCLAISNYLYAAPTVCGLVAMIDGKATPESLWQSQRAPGDKCTFYLTGSQMITKDTYKEYFNGIAKTLEFPIPYPAK
jgi:hypothetical protein